MAEPGEARDVKTEHFLALLLRGGVLLSAAVVLLGGILYLSQYGRKPAGMKPADIRLFHGEPDQLRKPTEIVAAALAGHSRGVIQLGLLILIATPVARVAFSALAFAREKDSRYVVLTLIVLTLLLCSLLFER